MFAKLKTSAKAFVNFFIGEASSEQSENAEPNLVIAAPKEIQEKAETTDGFPYYIDQKTTNTLYSLNTVYAALKLLDHNVVTYQLDSRFKTAPTIMRLFRSRKIFEVLHGTDVLLLKTNKELSEILKAQGLPYSGKKEVLIQRIAEKADVSELDLTPRYRLTDYGKEFKKSVFNRLHAAYCDLFVDCYNLIYNGQIAEAFTTIAKYECTKFYKRGLTWNGQDRDWVDVAKKGLSSSERDYYNKYMNIKKQSGEQVDACIMILSDFLGKRPSDVEIQYTQLINPEYPRKYNNGIIHSDIVYDTSRTEKNLESYRRCRIKKYSKHARKWT